MEQFLAFIFGVLLVIIAWELGRLLRLYVDFKRDCREIKKIAEQVKEADDLETLLTLLEQLVEMENRTKGK